MMSPALPLFLPLVAGDHGDILRANPVRRAALQPAQGHFGIHQRRAVIALQAVSLGRGERGPRPVALEVIDEAKLIPGKGIFVVASDGQLQDAPRLFEVRGIFGCDQRTAEHGGATRLVAGSLNRLPERRSEEHTSELQSLMRISYAVFCLTKKKRYTYRQTSHLSIK